MVNLAPSLRKININQSIKILAAQSRSYECSMKDILCHIYSIGFFVKVLRSVARQRLATFASGRCVACLKYAQVVDDVKFWLLRIHCKCTCTLQFL